MLELKRYGAKVVLSELSTDDVQRIREELTVSPKETEYNQYTLEHYRLYVLSRNHLYVPRFYGGKYFGSAVHLSEQAEARIESIQMQFEGTLRDTTNQNEASASVLREMRRHGGCILSLPTGYGKTTVALHVLCELGVKTLIVVHKEFLMEQWREKIGEFIPNARVGRIQGACIDVKNKEIVIGMLQSLSMKSYDAEIFETFGNTIIDEAHHVCTKTYSQLFQKCNTRYVLGLSATLDRSDGLGYVLHWYMGDIGYETSRRQQTHVQVHVKRPTLALYETRFPQNRFGTANLAKAINELVQDTGRNELLLEEIERCNKEGRKTIVLTDRRQHCEDLYNECVLRGYDAGLYLGGMKPHALKESEAKAVIIGTYTLAHEGLDIPSLDTIVLATPKTNIVQAVGRILRETTGKVNQPLIVDMVDGWGPFHRQYVKRHAYYRVTGFDVRDGVKEEKMEFLNEEK